MASESARRAAPELRGLPALLVSAALEQPLAPWLFFRSGLDWRWRSYGRVLEQVVAGVEVLRHRLGPGAEDLPPEHPSAAPPPGRGDLPTVRVGPADLSAPDGVAWALCVSASGLVVRVEGDGAIGNEGPGAPTSIELDSMGLPPCRPELDGPRPDPRALADSLQRTKAGPPAEATGDDGGCPVDLLPADLGIGSGRPVAFASPSCPPRAVFGLLGWLLEARAAWVLEPLPEAFVATTLWVRPSVVAAPWAELRALADAFGKTEARRSRLKALIAVSARGARPGQPVEAGEEAERITHLLGAPIVPWPA